jgi:RecA-family ATPase
LRFSKTEIPQLKTALIVKSANEWLDVASATPVPRRLFGDLWYEGELCILFADTGKGKTILAVQIGDAISSGVEIPGFALEAPRQKVLYLDFELSAKQFEARYSAKTDEGDRFTDHYEFDENFIRGEIDPDALDPGEGVSFEQYIIEAIEQQLEQSKAIVLIVDNITFLRSGTETAKDALPLMKELNRLKRKYELSIIVLAHTPKRDLSKPLTINDLQGSKMISNFADSVIAIGESSKDTHLRYIKQIKARSVEVVHGADNVVVCEVVKTHNFLHFEYQREGSEGEHLQATKDSDKKSLIDRAKELQRSGMKQRAIADELGISLGAVNKYLKI